MRKNKLFAGLQATELLDNLSTAVIVFDRGLRVRDANPAAESLFSMSIGKIRGVSLENLIPEARQLIAAMRGAQREGRTFSAREICLTGMHNGTLSVDCTVTPWWQSPDESPLMIMEITNTDRHHRIQAEENMLFQNQATTAVVRGLAHEIKNPLGGIRGAAQLLERELEDQSQAEYTQIIIGEADRLSKLVDSMLGPRGQTQTRPVNIHDVLERVRQIVEAEHSGYIVFRRDYDPSLPEIEADLDQLIQAFLNIVRNAVQALDEVDGTITMRTRIQRKFTIGTKLHRLVICAEIIDTGPGVDSAISDSIFFPMVSGRADGGGLGLPIAQSLVNRQGGLIEFSSEPGNTVFTVWLPIRTEK